MATPSPTALAVVASPSPSAAPSPSFAPSTCTNPTVTTRQVLERLFALSTSNDSGAVMDCYTKAYWSKVGSPQSAVMWSHDGPATNLVVQLLDTVKGCDRFRVTAQMSPDSFWMKGQGSGSLFFTLGPDTGGPRIYETGTALVNEQIATTTCPVATPVQTLNPSVNVCGTLVRFASDGNTQLARIDLAGSVTEYRLQVSRGTASPSSGIGTPYLVRLTGRQVIADTGSPDATNLVDYVLSRVSSC